MKQQDRDSSASQGQLETPQRSTPDPHADPAPAGADLDQVGNAAMVRLLAGTGGRVDRDAPTGTAGGTLDSGTAQRIEARRGGGAPLPPAVREPLQQQLGTDLSSARVHSDADADGLARSMQATAFTSGADMFFTSGSYQPGTSTGRELIAHEAVHVVQQGGGVARAAATTVSGPSDAGETEAYRLAPQLARGIGTPGPEHPPTEQGDGQRLTDGVVLALQRSAGNRATTAMVTTAQATAAPAHHAVQRQIGLPGHRWLRLGDTGPDVDELHRLLNVAGAAPPLAGSTFDAATQTALVAFQRAQGVGTDGIAGALTWGALDRIAGTAATPAPGPDQHADAARPDATERAAIRAELNPASAGPAGTVRAWDGHGTSVAAVAKQAALRAEVTAALEARLIAEMPAINASLIRKRRSHFGVLIYSSNSSECMRLFP